MMKRMMMIIAMVMFFLTISFVYSLEEWYIYIYR